MRFRSSQRESKRKLNMRRWAMLDGFSVVELRQYTLHEGTRERLIDLFENEFIESQEALGIRVIGPFRDLEDHNRFVWLRGFPDMDERSGMLAAFYDGPVLLAPYDAHH